MTTFSTMTCPAWPPPWLVLLTTDGPRDWDGVLAQRLLTTPGMEQAWADASARLGFWPPDTDGQDLFILLRNVRDEAHLLTAPAIGPLTAADDRDWWQDKAALVRELGTALAAAGVWEATPPLFSAASAQLEHQAAAIARDHPSPRPARGTTRHPRLKALVRILARELTGNNCGNVDHPGNKPLNHRHLATLATAILGPELDAPAPVTARMVKECLAGWRGLAPAHRRRNNL